MVYQIIYTSSAKASLDDYALREIAQISSYNNQALGISGLLLFHEGSIMQVLEGDKPSVQTLYAKINHDPRHTQCLILSERNSEAREFPNWFMGYKNATKSEETKALFALNATTLNKVLPQTPSPEISTLTKTYTRVNGL